MKQCLNCEAELIGPYCHHCGQKGSTHRYSLKSLLTHDLLHSIWHVDKSILRSWWQVLKAPGREGHKNIAGKRAAQFPVITLAIFATILLLLTVNFRAPDEHLVVSFSTFDFSDWARHNAKWFWLSLIFFFALSTLIFFRRLRYNISEHIVLTTYNYVGLVTVMALLLFIYRLTPASWLWLDWLNGAVLLAYVHYIGWHSFKSAFTLIGWYWRFLFSLFTFMVILILLLLATAFTLSQTTGNGRFKIHYGAEAPAEKPSILGVP